MTHDMKKNLIADNNDTSDRQTGNHRGFSELSLEITAIDRVMFADDGTELVESACW